LLQRLHKSHFSLPIIGLSPVIFTEKKEIRHNKEGVQSYQPILERNGGTLCREGGSHFSPQWFFFWFAHARWMATMWAWWITFYHIYNVDSILLWNYLIMW
jgi:hypothetical protein